MQSGIGTSSWLVGPGTLCPSSEEELGQVDCGFADAAICEERGPRGCTEDSACVCVGSEDAAPCCVEGPLAVEVDEADAGSADAGEEDAGEESATTTAAMAVEVTERERETLGDPSLMRGRRNAIW